ncbi:thiamine-monophosphate kinase [Candidatus Omnitrophota bacterium]
MHSNSNSRISELGLIDYFRKTLKKKNSKIVKGIGDDAAVIKINKDKYLLNTSDMLIEGRHFRSRDDLGDIGYKAIACSLSDIAAMGGSPSFALVSLGIPKRLKSKDIKSLFSGIKKSADRFGVNIVGGDTNLSQKLIIDISMTGFVDSKKLTLRSNARVGDYIFVTGSLGGSIYQKHLKFTPRVKEAQYLTTKFKLNSMIDISDGLILDLWRVLKASRVGAAIYEDLIPKSKDAKNLNQALYMGEDFELLFTVSEKNSKTLLRRIRENKFDFDLSFIGKIMDKKEQIWLIDRHKKSKKLKPKGFLHF